MFQWVALIALTSVTSLAEEHKHWSYHGETGPSHWAALDSKNALCSNGQEQSPINLKWSRVKGQRQIAMHYQPTTVKAVDNGHTIQFNFAPGNSIELDGETYQLLQMHFHTPSEHTVSGKSFPLELHFVHKSTEGSLAVIGVMFKEGQENKILKTLWAGIPSEKNKEIEIDGWTLDPRALMPTKHTHYHYAGSLTTPPCSEKVNWNVLNSPIEASTEQIGAFKKLYPINARPAQPLNSRKLENF